MKFFQVILVLFAVTIISVSSSSSSTTNIMLGREDSTSATLSLPSQSENLRQERQGLLQSSASKETAAVVLGQMLRQFLETNFRRLSFELNATQANIYQELAMLQGLEHDVKRIGEVVTQLDRMKMAISDLKFVKDVFADTQYIKESQIMLSKKTLDTLMQLIQLSYSGALMIGDVHDRLARKQNCVDIRDGGKNSSGVYTIWPQGLNKPGADVFCDMELDGGGWTIIQRRGYGPYGTSRNINFNRTWEEYRNGFGDVSIDYWLGLENLRGLTRNCPYELLVNMSNWSGESKWAHYDRFVVGSELDFYRLSLEGHTGTAEDSFLYHHGKQFSTYDKDNDENWGDVNGNCAATYGGGWWFGDCLRSHLNGKYFQNDGFLRKDALNGIRWNSWTGMKESLKMSEMKIRPRCGFFSFT